VVYADRTALEQILLNLVENALRHTSEGGHVIIETTPAQNGVHVIVRDTGSGIPPEHLPRIFERFYRADSGRSRESGGTGLGLAIVKHMVEAHDGTVRADSVLGAGATITVFFPSRPGAVES
jgi:signal transduction histidine kinase